MEKPVEKPQRCKFCGKFGHGKSATPATREKSCTAWGETCSTCNRKNHFTARCLSKPKAKANMLKLNRMKTKVQTVINKESEKNKPDRFKNMKPLTHEIYDDEKAEYVKKLPPKDAKIHISMQVDSEAYINHKPELPCSMMKEFCVKKGSNWVQDKTKSTPKTDMTADTGAQVDIVGKDRLHKLGLTVEELLKTSVGLDCANNIEAGVLGVFFAKISGNSIVSGDKLIVNRMVYVIKGNCCLMSKATLTALGCLPENFPEIGRFTASHVEGADGVVAGCLAQVAAGRPPQAADSHSPVRQPEGQCDPESSLPCSCPRRQLTDPPDTLPMPATASNGGALE